MLGPSYPSSGKWVEGPYALELGNRLNGVNALKTHLSSGMQGEKVSVFRASAYHRKT